MNHICYPSLRNTDVSLLNLGVENTRLPVETGAYIGVPREKRTCHVCKTGVGDEFHYLLECKHFINDRQKFLKKRYWHRPSTIKMEELMNVKGKTLTDLCKFITVIMDHVNGSC